MIFFPVMPPHRKKRNRIGRAQKKSKTNRKYWEKEKELAEQRKLRRLSKTYENQSKSELSPPAEVLNESFDVSLEAETENDCVPVSPDILIELNEDCAIIAFDPEHESAELQDKDGFSAHEFYLVADKVVQYDPAVEMDIDELYSNRFKVCYSDLNAKPELIKNGITLIFTFEI